MLFICPVICLELKILCSLYYCDEIKFLKIKSKPFCVPCIIASRHTENSQLQRKSLANLTVKDLIR